MNLKSITIENLLSFESSTFDFEKYNVIVGPNNSGKTNLLRILKMLMTDDLIRLEIKQKLKFDQEKKSQIKLTLEATEREIRMIWQAITHKYVEAIPDSKRFTIIWSWPDLGTTLTPKNIILYFQNGVAIIFMYSVYHIFYLPSFEPENSEEFLNELCNLDYNSLITKIKKDTESLSINDKGNIGQIINKDPAEVFLHGTRKSRCILKGEAISCSTDPQKQTLELANYVNLDISLLRDEVAPMDVVSKIIKNSFISVEEMHPAPQHMTDQLFDLKSQNEQGYMALQKSFEEIFTGVRIRVEQSSSSNNKKTIWVTENGKTLNIADSASGYLEAIHILYKILDNVDCVIFLDEPEIHFHPVKIRQVGQKLLHLTKDTHNQLIVVSHSPQFLDYRLLSTDYSSALISVTKRRSSSFVASPNKSTIQLKPHLFEPDMFFADAVFLVEGASDEYVIRAISNRLDGFFEQYGIVIVNCRTVYNIDLYAELLDAYHIVHYGMADKEYSGKDPNIVTLDEDLETELRKTGLKVPKKIKPERAHIVIDDLLKTSEGFELLKETKIWTSIENVRSNQSTKPS